VRELKADSENGSRLQVLDVRSPEEFDKGHIPGAEHRFVADMRRRIDGLDKERPIATYCASGYRASLASSLMQSRGFKNVSNVPGSWEAWIQSGYPVETPSS
jgi:hydroxyacylglutathione hydrolase